MALNLHDEKKKWLDWAIEIQSLAQAGMTYMIWSVMNVCGKFQQKCYLTKQIFQ